MSYTESQHVRKHCTQYVAMLVLRLNPDDTKDRKIFSKLLDEKKISYAKGSTWVIDRDSILAYIRREEEKQRKMEEQTRREILESLEKLTSAMSANTARIKDLVEEIKGLRKEVVKEKEWERER